MAKNTKKIIVFYKSRGFTLIETIVTIAIFGSIMVLISSSILYFYRAHNYTIEQSFAIESARRGIEVMVREIREVTYSDTGAYPVVSAGLQSFSFYSDVDKDSNVEKIRYFLDGTSFKRGSIKASGNPLVYNAGDEEISVLSDNVRNDTVPIFHYYDQNGAEIINLSNVTSIALVSVDLMVNVTLSRAPDEFILRSSANLRNLKINL